MGKWIGGALVATLIGAMAYWVANTKVVEAAEAVGFSKTVTAELLQIADKNGRVRIELTTIDDAATIRMCDASGRPRLVLAVLPQGGAIVTCMDAEAKPRISMTNDNFGPAIRLYAANGRTSVAVLNCLENPQAPVQGAAALNLYSSRTGKARASLVVLPGGPAAIALNDTTGKIVWGATSGEAVQSSE